MTTHRTVIKAELEPLAGTLFQPTGFPDLGASEFEDGEKKKRLLVESAQSMANWLEGTTWDDGAADQVAELAPLPHVRIVSREGDFLSSSRLEAHRLASAYVMDGTIESVKGRDWLLGQFGLVKGRPLDNRAVARACFRLDPVSLVHGVFFAQPGWPWQPKIARAVTSFIEAEDVRPAVSGGVKRDRVRNESEEGTSAKEGYGSVPHHRVEYTARKITAYFTVDHLQFRSYGLSKAATGLLEALADYEIGTLLADGLRLRTRCDLVVKNIEGEQPDPHEAANRIAKLVTECANELGPVNTATWSGRVK